MSGRRTRRGARGSEKEILQSCKEETFPPFASDFVCRFIYIDGLCHYNNDELNKLLTHVMNQNFSLSFAHTDEKISFD
jgi:hypothetical protein